MKAIAFKQPIGKKEMLPEATIIQPVNTKTLVTTSDLDHAYIRELEEKGIYLDAEQLEAVRTVDGPTVLMAGAGSGKTRVLTSRVGYLLAQTNIHPSEIMLVTFTTKAAGEMEERLTDLLGVETVQYMMIGTFHSIFLKLLRSQRYYQTVLASEAFKRLILKGITKELRCDSILAPEIVASKISGWKNQMLMPSDIQVKNMMDRHIVNCYERYEQWLQENNYMDFDDVLIKSVLLLEGDENLRDFMKTKFRSISIDEMQDSNYVQSRLIELITEPDSNVFFVGDPQQAIYGFRHSSPNYMKDLQVMYPSLKTLYLSTNYRSTNKIVGAANSILIELLNESKVVHHSAEGLYFVRPKDVHEEACQVADSIEESMRVGTIATYADSAVLYRINTYGRAILEELVYRKLPIRVTKSDLFYENTMVKQVLSYLRMVVNENDYSAIADLATTLYIQRDTAYDHLINHYTEELSGIKRLKPICADYQVSLLEKRAMLIQRIALLEPKYAIQRIRTEFYDRFVKSIADNSLYQDTIANILNELETAAQRFKTIEAFVAFIDQLAEQLQQLNDETGITLSTIHGAKGLEWEQVYVVGVIENLIPHFSAVTNIAKPDQVLHGQAALMEENRLLYVAMTRAKRELYVSSPKVYHGKPTKLSSFLTDKS